MLHCVDLVVCITVLLCGHYSKYVMVVKAHTHLADFQMADGKRRLIPRTMWCLLLGVGSCVGFTVCKSSKNLASNFGVSL